MFLNLSIGMPVVIKHLHFWSGIPGVFVFAGVFIHQEYNPTVSFWRNFPFYFEIEVFVTVIGDYVTTFTILEFFHRLWCRKVNCATIYLPRRTNGCFSIRVPSVCSFSIKQRDPIIGSGSCCWSRSCTVGFVCGS